MGQLLGKARIRAAAEPFVNLDQAAVYCLWEAFNDVAEGFGINVEELVEMVTSLQNTVFNHAQKQVILVATEEVFKSLDTDKNNLVDSLEVLVTICMLSGLELREKAKFCFMCYDFDESGEVTVDELTLLFKSCASGLCKLSEETSLPEEVKIEQLAQEAFRRTGKNHDVRISSEEFVDYCISTPEILAWCDFYDEATDFSAASQFQNKLSSTGFEEKRKTSVRNVFSALVPLNDVLREESVAKTRSNTQAKAKDPDCERFPRPTGKLEITPRPWLETASITIPTNPPNLEQLLPQPDDHVLKLEWVHGYAAQHCRNNLRYTSTGEIVYPAASIGVVYSPETHEQRFNLDHTDDILAVAVHPDGNYVATGERGCPPKIHIWDSSSMALVVTLRGVHGSGIASLAFSPSSGGKWLISVGQDPDHVVTLYDWERRAFIFSARSTTKRVFDVICRWSLSEGGDSGSTPSFVTCGEDHIFFWNQDENRKKKHGIFGRIGSPQTMLCLACHPKNNRIISGALSGHLYIWDANRNLQRTIKAHDSAVSALYVDSNLGLLSGGEDGKVRLWSLNFEQGATFDVSGLGSLYSPLSSVCYSDDGQKLLVGTRGGEIFEMSAEDGSNLHPGPLICSHFSGELHGLAIHPHKLEFCTVGDDQTVRIWSTETHRMIRMVRIDAKARCCAYSPDGSLIAVGLGGGTNSNGSNKKDGAFLILNEADLCVIHEARDSKKWISEIKFASDGSTLAIASSDCAIYLYNVEDFASKGKCKGHHGVVENLDFSEDGQCIQSSCSANELLFWNANTGEQYKKPSTIKDVEWSSNSCPVGYATQGMWTASGAIDVQSSEKNQNGTIIVGGDIAGRLRMFHFPACNEKQGFNEFRGHSSNVRRLRFVFDDSSLVTVGQEDRCILQWGHESDQVDGLPEEEVSIYRNEPDSEDEDDFLDGVELDRTDAQEMVNNQSAKLPGREKTQLRSNSDEMYRIGNRVEVQYLDDSDTDTAEGEEKEELEKKEGEPLSSLPDRPWTRLIVPPSDPPKENHTTCDEGLTLEWVHGYNAKDTRGTVKYLPNGEIVFPAANLSVVHNKQGGGVQKFFTDHTDKVVSLAIHPEGSLIATGQMGNTPKIIIWNVETMESVRILVGFHKRSITALKFSKDGNSIVSAGLDDDHQIVVYDWKNGIISMHCNGGSQKILDVDFSPSGKTIVQCGINHIKFHDLCGRNAVSRKGLLGKKGKLQAMYCIGWSGNKAVIGTADGHLYGFDGRVLQQSVKGHERSIFCIHSCTEGIVTGGKDGWVKIWTPGLEVKAQFSLGENPVSIRSVCWNPDTNTIAVGTRHCEIFEISASDGSNTNGKGPLLQSHNRFELWGLAVHPNKSEYCTVGDDQTVRIWDAATHTCVKTQKLDTSARACAYSPDGTKIAVGLGAKTGKGRQKKDGSFLILNEKDLATLHEGRNSKQWITELKFSLDGATLAVGSYDNSVYLYDIPGGYTLKGVFEGHNSFITHLDISMDGQFVQTNCGAYEFMYCDANSGTNIPAVSTLKDVQWSTWTCVFGWPVKGIHESTALAPVIHATHRSASGNLLASVDEFGRLDLRRFPCVETFAGKKTYRGHSGNVRNCRFLANDDFLITVGGDDRCIMQWKVSTFDEDVTIRAGESGADSDVVVESKAVGPEGLAGSASTEYVAVRPWISAVVPPTGAASATEQGLDAPTHVELQLEYIYGHRSEDVRNNLRYNSVGQIVYFAAATGIIYDKSSHSQIFYLGHDGHPIISLAMHPEGKYVATGEGSARNRPRTDGLVRVHVWNALTGNGVFKLPAFHKNAASQLCFCADGSRLVTVGEDENHTVAIWRSDSGTWTDARLQATAMGGQDKVLFACFYGNFHLATGGVNHLTFWTLHGQTLTPRKGHFGRKGKLQPLLCAAAVGFSLSSNSSEEGLPASVGANAKIATGTVTGHLYVWSDGEVSKSIKAHERTVNSIQACHLGLVTGSKDGVVKLWDTKLSPLRTFDMTEAIPTPHRPAIRSVSWDSRRGLVLIGTQGSEIYEVTTENQSVTLVSQGHSMDELHGLAPHPTNPNIFATAGDDQTVRLWDASKRRIEQESNVGCMSRAVCWSPDGQWLGVGLGGTVGRGRQKKDGAVMVLDSSALGLVHETRDSKEWIADAKFSPDGATLAVASFDNKIYLYDVHKNFELRAKCEGHNSFVLHVDFSEDSEYIRSNCGGFDLLFHKNEDGTLINSPSMLKDVKWATSTCCLSWYVQGMWPEVTDETNYNACDVSEGLNLLASVDNQGFVNLFHYPAITKGASALRRRAHVSQVSNVKFNSDCSLLFTTGGPDRVLCQWRVKRVAVIPKRVGEQQGNETELEEYKAE